MAVAAVSGSMRRIQRACRTFSGVCNNAESPRDGYSLTCLTLMQEPSPFQVPEGLSLGQWQDWQGQASPAPQAEA